MNKSYINKILVSILLILFVGMGYYLLKGNSDTVKKRTIMIYMSGSDLETKAGAATSDINAINPREVDLDSMNILLYTGGSSKWHNSLINNNENAIYELNKSGFKKIKSYEQENMSSSETLSDYLNYVYDNYKTDIYDLLVWDHGGAWQGAISDDFNEGDYLELKEFRDALDNSPFKDNKMEAVIFKTCLNSSYEVSVILSQYANYLIGSEEVTFAGNIIHALDFLNTINGETDPVTIGKEYAESYYDNTIVKGNLKGRRVMAFSVVDLNKINNLTEELKNFFNGIDINENYEDISRTRNSLHEYGGNKVRTFDVVDTYHLVSDLSSYSTYDSDKVIKAFNDTVVNCYTTNERTSKCLSIFFPFNGFEKSKNYGFTVYKDLELNDDYYNFINSFSFKQSQAATSTSMLRLDEGHFTNDIIINNKELSLELTDDEKKDILDIKYYVFKKDNNNYNLIKKGDNTIIEGNKLLIDLSNKYLKVNNEYVTLNYIDNSYTVNGYLDNELKDISNLSNSVNYTISDDHKILLTMDDIGDEVIGSIIYDYKDYNYLYFNKENYEFNKEFDIKWKDSLKEDIRTIKNDDLNINLGYLDNGDYYCLLEIKDINNRLHYTQLEKIK